MRVSGHSGKDCQFAFGINTYPLWQQVLPICANDNNCQITLDKELFDNMRYS